MAAASPEACAAKSFATPRSLARWPNRSDIRLKGNPDDRDAGQRLRLDVLHVVDRGRNGVLAEGRDLLRHLIGGEATVLPDNGDHWNIDLRKNVRWRVFDRRHAQVAQSSSAITTNV